MIDTTAEARAAAVPAWRRLAFSPVLWGIVLLMAAVALTLATADLDLPQFLLMLVGGWCLGYAFVNLTFRMPRHGAVLHLGGALVVSALVVLILEVGGPLIQEVPDLVRVTAVVVQLAGAPAAAWIWIGLIGRVTSAVTHTGRRNPTVRVPPSWEREETGDGSVVRFPAVEMRMRDVVLAIVGIVLVIAAAVVVLLILFDDVVTRLGARFSVVLVAVVLGVPAYALLTAVLRRRTEQCTVAFGGDELRIGVGPAASVIPFAELEFLRWRMRSDYARVEARGGGVDLSLFAGLAKAPQGRTAELPELPRRVLRLLELAGLTMETSRRGEVVTFRRA